MSPSELGSGRVTADSQQAEPTAKVCANGIPGHTGLYRDDNEVLRCSDCGWREDREPSTSLEGASEPRGDE